MQILSSYTHPNVIPVTFIPLWNTEDTFSKKRKKEKKFQASNTL